MGKVLKTLGRGGMASLDYSLEMKTYWKKSIDTLTSKLLERFPYSFIARSF